MSKPRCETCKHWDGKAEPQRGLGRCRYHIHSKGKHFEGYNPITDANTACGEHQPKEPSDEQDW